MGLDDDVTLTATKARCLLGIARLELSSLDFELALKRKHREESEKAKAKAKARLLNVFKLEGCHRLDEENFVDALIDRHTFDIALEHAGLHRESFKTLSQKIISRLEDIPKLTLRSKADCINGLHRIRAAEAYLDRNDQWWTVRLYSREGFGDYETTLLVESFAHEQRHTDGVIFRNIRLCSLGGDKDGEKKWWARLTDTKRKDLQQLLKNEHLTKAFDNLLDFVGLWPPIQLGQLHRLHGIRCTEMLISRLEEIRQVWDAIVPEKYRCHVDSGTVRKVELTAPGISTHDKELIKRMMTSKSIFPGIQDDTARYYLLQEITSIKIVIPSLRTFFEDQKYLEPGSLILRELLGPSEKRSLWRGFSANYFKPQQLTVESSERTFCSVSRETIQSSNYNRSPLECEMALGYIQLWMFCFRHFPEMTSITPKQSPGKTRVKRHHNPALWQRLGKLALQLGFKTTAAIQLAEKNANNEHAKQFLQTARPDFHGNCGPYVSRVADILDEMEELSSTTILPVFTDDKFYSRDRRCGKPCDDDHDQDKGSLFISLFYHDIENGRNITSLYAKREIFRAFLRPYILQAKPYTAHLDAMNSTPVETLQREPLNNQVNELDRLRDENRRLRLRVAELNKANERRIEEPNSDDDMSEEILSGYNNSQVGAAEKELDQAFQLQRVESENADLHTQLAKSREIISGQETQIHHNERKISDLKETLKTTNECLAQERKVLELLRGEEAKAKNRIMHTSQETGCQTIVDSISLSKTLVYSEKLETKLTEAEADINKLKAVVAESKMRVETLEKQGSQREIELHKLRVELATRSRELYGLKEKHGSCEADLESCKHKVESCKMELTERQLQWEADLKSHKDKVATYKTELTERQLQLDQMYTLGNAGRHREIYLTEQSVEGFTLAVFPKLSDMEKNPGVHRDIDVQKDPGVHGDVDAQKDLDVLYIIGGRACPSHCISIYLIEDGFRSVRYIIPINATSVIERMLLELWSQESISGYVLQRDGFSIWPRKLVEKPIKVENLVTSYQQRGSWYIGRESVISDFVTRIPRKRKRNTTMVNTHKKFKGDSEEELERLEEEEEEEEEIEVGVLVPED